MGMNKNIETQLKTLVDASELLDSAGDSVMDQYASGIVTAQVNKNETFMIEILTEVEDELRDAANSVGWLNQITKAECFALLDSFAL